MRLFRWLLSTLRGFLRTEPQVNEADARRVELMVTRLEPRVVLNASPVVALFDADSADLGEQEVGTIEITAGSDADDGDADEFRLTSDGSRFHIDVNDERVYSGDIDDAHDIVLRGSGDADRFVIDVPDASAIPDGLRIDGGSSEAIDSIVLQVESVRKVDYEFSNAGEHVRIDGRLLTFDSVESVVDTIDAHARFFVYADSPDRVTLGDHASDGFSHLDDWIQFSSNADELTIRAVGSGHTVVGVHGLDSGFDGDLVIDAGVDGSLNVFGEVSTSGLIDLDAGSIVHEGYLAGSDILIEADTALEVTGDVVAFDGGTIHLLGEEVSIEGESRIDASGSDGGGEILIGGDYLGSNPNIRNAQATHVGEDVVITADAVERGDGGRVIVWSDGTTTAFGSGNITARGGAVSGDGGFIETSGKELLRIGGAANAGAANGLAGTWLLDPRNVTIVSATPLSGSYTESAGTYTPTSDDTEILASTIVTALASSNVVINTGSDGSQAGNITVNAAISYSGTVATALTLDAAGSIFINQVIETTSTRDLAVTLQAGGDITVSADITTDDGDFSATAGGNFISTGHIQTDDASITIVATGTASLGQMTTDNGTSGSLNVTAAGITDTGTLLIDGAATFTSAEGTSIVLDSATNAFNGSLTFASSGPGNLQNLTLVDTTAVDLQGLTLDGDLSVTVTNGTLTDSGALTVGGTTTLSAGVTGSLTNITLNASNNFVGAVSITQANNVTLVDTDGGIILGSADVGGTMTVTGDGITDTGALVVDNAATFTSAEGTSIVLDSATNVFNGSLSFASLGPGNLQNLTLVDTTAVALQGLTLDGDLSVTVTNGALTDTGNLTVGGTTTLSAGVSGSLTDITLDANNDFVGAVLITQADDVELNDIDSGILLGASTVSGTLDVTATGDITDSGSIVATGLTTLDSGGNITLDRTDHDFSSVHIDDGSVVTINDANSVTIDDVALGSSLSVTAGTDGVSAGSIIVAGPMTSSSAANVTLTAQNGGGVSLEEDLSLSGGDFNSVGASFSADALTRLLAGSVTLVHTSAVTLSEMTITGALDVTAGGTISDRAGEAIDVGTTTQLTAGAANDIVLDTGHDFTQVVRIGSANDVTIVATGGVILGTSTISGSLDLTTDGTITDVAAESISVAGTTTLDTGNTSNVTLDSGHSFTGAVRIDDADDVTLTATGGIVLGASTIDGFLSVSATDSITDIAGEVISVGSTTTLSTAVDKNIVLDTGHDFGGNVAVSSALDVTLNDTGTLRFNASTITGALDATAVTNITDAGAISVGTTTTLNAGGSVNLNAANDFGGSVSVSSATSLTLNDVNSITLGSLAPTGAIDVDAADDITLTGSVTSGTSLAFDAGGSITIDGTINPSGTMSVALTSTGTDASDGVDINASVTTNDGSFGSSGVLFDADAHIDTGSGDANINHAGAVDLGQMTIATGGNLDVVAGGDITETGVLSIAGTSGFETDDTFSVLLGTNTHTFTGVVTFIATSGTLDDVAIRDSSSLDLNGLDLSGDLTVEATGITDSGEITVVGTTTLTSTGLNDITLDRTDSDYATLILSSEQNASVLAATAIVVGSADIDRDLTLHSQNGSITNTGVLDVSGATSLTAGTAGTPAAISLTGDNLFGGAVTVIRGSDVTLHDADDITLSSASVSSSLTVLAGTGGGSGSITTTGSISSTAAASLSFTAQNGGDVTIGDDVSLTGGSFASSGSSFQSAGAHISGGATTISHTSTVSLGQFTVSSLDVTANGAITDTNSETISVTGTTTLAAGAANNITLDTGHAFDGAVSITSGLNVLIEDNGSITLGASTISGTLDITAASNIVDLTTDPGSVVVAGHTTFDAGGVITLDRNDHDFSSVQIDDGSTVELRDANDIALAGVVLDTSLTVLSGAGGGAGGISATGAMTAASAADVTLTAQNGGNVVVGADVSLSGGSFASSGADFTATGTTISGLDATINHTGSVAIGSLTLTNAGQSLDVDADTGIDAAGVLSLSGTADFTTAGGTSIVLANVSNNMQGQLNLTSSDATNLDDVTVRNQSAIALSALTIDGDLVLESDAAISAGALVVGLTTSVEAGAGSNITLDDNGNDFVGSVTVVNGSSVTIHDADSISLGSTQFGTELTVIAGADGASVGDISTTAAMTSSASANATLTAQNGGDVSIGGDVSLSGGAFSSTGTSFVASSAHIQAGAASFNHTDSVSLGQTTTASTLSIMAGGDVTDSGAIVVGTSTTIDAGTNAVTLDHADNDFGSGVTVSNATSITLQDINDLTLQSLGFSGSLSATAADDVTLASAVTAGTSVALNAGADITINAAISSASAIDVTLTATGDVDINAAVSTNDGAFNSSGAAFDADAHINTGTGSATVNHTGTVDLGQMTLDTDGTITGDLTVTAGGDITETGVLAVAGDSTFETADGFSVLLNSSTHTFDGVIDFNSVGTLSVVSVVDSNAIDLQALSAATLNVNAVGITDSGTLAISGTATLTSTGAADIVLDETGSTFGTLSLNSQQNAAVTTTAGAINLGASDVDGDLSVQALGISDSGAVVVDGIASFASSGGSNDIVLDFATNDFESVELSSGRNVTIVDIDNLTFGASTIAGTLDVTAVGVTDDGVGLIDVGSTTTIDAGAGNVTLDSLHDFGGSVSVSSAANVTLNDSNSIEIGGLSATGAIDVDATGDLTLSSAVTSGTSLAFDAGGNITIDGSISSGSAISVALAATGNVDINQSIDTGDGAFSSSGVVFDADSHINTGTGDAVISHSGAVDLGQMTVSTDGGTTGDLDVTAGGDITESGVLSVAGTSTFTSTMSGSSVLLGTNTHTFTGVISFVAVSGTLDSVTVIDSTAIDLSALTLSGSLSVSASEISDSGTLSVSGTTALTATGTNGIVLDDANSNFAGLTLNSAGVASVVDVDTIVMAGTSSVAGDLTLTASAGTITDTGTLSVTGETNLSAGSSLSPADISLDGANDFGGAVNVFAGDAVTLNDSSGIVLGQIDANSLSVSTGGDITDSTNAITIAGATSLDAGTAHIVLDAGHSFSGVVEISAAGDATIVDTGAIMLGAISTTGLLDVTAGGDITDDGAGVLSVGTTATFDAGTADVVLDFGHSFTSTVSVDSAANVTLEDNDSIVLGAISATGTLDVTAPFGISSTGALDIAGAASFTTNAGQSIVLSDAGNQMSGTLTFTASGGDLDDLTIRNQAAIDMAALSITGDLVLDSDGTITGSGAWSIGQTTTLTAGTVATPADVTLTNANNFGGAVSISRAGHVQITDTGSLAFGASTIAGDLTAVADGSVTSSGSITVTGDASFDATSNAVTLDDNANDFGGTVSVSNATAVTLHDANSITLGSLGFTTSLNVVAGADGMSLGGVSTTAAITTSSSSSVSLIGQNGGGVTLGANVSLSGGSFGATGEDFTSSGFHIEAGSTTLNHSGAVTLGQVTLTGALDVTGSGGIVDAAGVIVVGTTTSLDAGSSNVTLDLGHSLGGVVTIVDANNVTLSDTGSITLGAGNIVGSLTAVAVGSIVDDVGSLSVGATADLSAGVDIVLDTGHDFDGAVEVSAVNVSLVDVNSIELGDSSVSGTLSVSSVGVTNSGDVVVVGTTTIDAGGGSVALGSSGNDFSTIEVADASNVTVHDTTNIDVGSVSLTGDLTVSADTDITLSQAITTGSGIDFDAGDDININAAIGGTGTRTVSLDSAGGASVVTIDASVATNNGSFASTGATYVANAAITTGTGDASIDFTGAVDLSQMTVGGELDVAAGGDITNAGALIVTGAATFTAAEDASITLGNTDNELSGDLTFAAATGNLLDVTIANKTDVILKSITLGGDLDVTTDGSISDSGDLTVTGTTRLDAGTTGDITLTHDNDFGLAVTIVEGRNVSLNDTDSLVLGDGAISGTFAATTGGSITDAGILNVSGATTFDSGANDIVLDDDHNFSDAVSITAANVTLNDVGSLTLGASSITGTVTVTAAGDATDSGVLSVAGDLSIDVGANDVTLDNANDFMGSVSITASDVHLVDSNSIDLGTIAASGTLDVTATGGITDSAVIQVAGTTTLTAGAGNIVLDSANLFADSVVVVSGHDVTLVDADQLELGASTISGQLTVEAGTSIVNSDTLNVTGDAAFTAQAGQDILLNAAGNSFGGGLSFFANGSGNLNNVSVTSANAIDLASLQLDGGLTVSSDDAITDSGTLIVAGTTTLSAGATSDITLSDASSDFSVVVISQARSATFVDANSVVLGGAGVSNDLEVSATGAITDTADLTVGGTATFGAGAANDIVLDNDNDFSTVETTSGFNVSLFVVGTLDLGNMAVSGQLDVQADGDISNSGDLLLAGNASFTSTDGSSIQLSDTDNSFGGSLSFNSSGAGSLLDVTVIATSGIDLAVLDIDGALALTADGNITDSGQLTVGGAATLDAGANDIVFDDSLGDFTSVSISNADNVLIHDQNAIELAGAAVVSGLNVVTAGNITDTGSLVIGGTATFQTTNVGTVILDDAANDFGTISFNDVLDVEVVDQNALDIAASTIDGTLDVTAGGAVTDSGAVVVNGATTLSVGSGNDITLTDTGNDFSSIAVISGREVQITDQDELVLDASSIANNLTLIASGDVSASSTLAVGGTATVTTDVTADVDFTSTSNDFSTVSVLSARDVTLGDVNEIDLGAINIDGSLVVTAGSNITDSGSLQVSGDASFILPGGLSITLDEAGHTFGGDILFNSSDANLLDSVTLTTVAAIDIGSLTLAGDLTLTSTEAIRDAGALVVAGTTTVSTAASRNVLFDDASNDFGTLVVTSAQNVTVTDQNNVDFGSSTISGSFTVTANGAITDNGSVVVSGTTSINAGSGNTVVFDDNGGDFQSVAVTGASDIEFVDSNSLVLNAIDGDTLRITSDGDVTQSAGLVLTGDAQFDVGSGNQLVLTDAANDFQAEVTLVAVGDAMISDANDLSLGVSTVSGALSLTALGDITSTSAIVVSGTTSLDAGSAGDVEFSNAANDFAGDFAVNSARDVEVTDSNAISFGSISLDRDLSVQAGGSVTQTAGLSVGRNLTVDAGAANDVVLDRSDNDLMGSVTLNANNIELVDSDDLELGAISAAGNATLTASGDITQSNSVQVSGSTRLDAGTNDIVLTDSGNTFAGVFEIDAADSATIVDSGAFEFGAVVVSNTIDITANGDVTQSNAIQQSDASGSVSISVSNGDIVLTDAANQFAGTLALSSSTSNDVTVDYVGSLRLGDVSLTSTTVEIEATDLQLQGDFAASDGDLRFATTDDTTISGSIDAASASVAFVVNAITMDDGSAIEATDGTITVSATSHVTLGSISTDDGDITIDSSGGNILDGGNADFDLQTDTGNVSLTANRIGSTGNAIETAIAVLVASGDAGVFIQEASDIVLSTVTSASGEVDVTVVSGTMTAADVQATDVTLESQAGSIVDDGDASTSIMADSLILVASDSLGSSSEALNTNVDSITADATNLFVDEADQVTVTSVSVGDSAEILNRTGDMTIESIEAGDTVQLTSSNGSIVGANAGTDIESDRLALNAAGSVTLDSEVATLAADASGDISITNSTSSLTIGSVSSVAGLSTDSGSVAITQSGSLQLNQAVTNLSTGDISLDAGSLDLGADVTAADGGDITLTSGSTMIVDGTVSTTDDGFITPTAADGISFTDDGSFDTPTGISRSETPVLVDLESPIITSAGIGEVSGTFGITGEESFTITIDWGDGSAPDVLVRTQPGTFNENHQYLADDTTNGLSELTITVTVTYNAALNGVDSTVATTAAQVPGEGIVTAVVSTAAAPPPIEIIEVTDVIEEQQVTNVAANNQAVELVTAQMETVEAAETRVLLRVLSESGEELETIELDEGVLDNLPQLFERLPDGRYSISIKEAGDERERLVMDLNVREGRATDNTEPASNAKTANRFNAEDRELLEQKPNREFQLANSIGEFQTVGREQLERLWHRLTAMLNSPKASSLNEDAIDVSDVELVAMATPATAEPARDDTADASDSNALWWATATAGTAGASLLARRLLRRAKAAQNEQREIAASRAKLEQVLPSGPFEASETENAQTKSRETVETR